MVILIVITIQHLYCKVAIKAKQKPQKVNNEIKTIICQNLLHFRNQIASYIDTATLLPF